MMRIAEFAFLRIQRFFHAYFPRISCEVITLGCDYYYRLILHLLRYSQTLSGFFHTHWEGPTYPSRGFSI